MFNPEFIHKLYEVFPESFNTSRVDETETLVLSDCILRFAEYVDEKHPGRGLRWCAEYSNPENRYNEMLAFTAGYSYKNGAMY